MILTVVVPGEPCSQGRGRAFRYRSRKDGKEHLAVFDPTKSRNWKATAQQHMSLAISAAGRKAPLFKGPVHLCVLAVFSCPRSDYRTKQPRPRRWHTKRGDSDNIAKAAADAGLGLLWLDDAQVAQLEVLKIIAAQGEPPYVEIRARALADEECSPRRT